MSNSKIKKRSQIIIDLINDQIDVSQALEILDLLLEEIQEETIKKWVDSEINGYDKNAKLPDYRIINATVRGSYLVGNYYNSIKGTNQPLPLKSEYIKDFTKIEVRDGINEIKQLSQAEKEAENHFLLMPIDLTLAQHISLINGEITSADINISMYAYTSILGKLKTKILSIFKELEKHYGNLDSYYIDFNNDSEEKEIVQNIINIIFDNSVSIGNDNKISNSILGDNNEI